MHDNVDMAASSVASSELTVTDIAALLDWWKLSGVDVTLSEEPNPWLGMPDMPATGAFALQTGPSAPKAAVFYPTELAPPAPVASPRSQPARATGADVNWEKAQSLAELTEMLRRDHPRAIWADGNPESGLMILGEAPSNEDLRTGRPFTGPAGLFLDRMLAAIGLDRRKAYISLLCPRRDRAGVPPPDAIEADLALTRAHIRLAKPRHLLLMGANPVKALTHQTAPISRIRGQWLDVSIDNGAIPALATYNPAYLLRRPEEKAKAWADLIELGRRLTA